MSALTTPDCFPSGARVEKLQVGERGADLARDLSLDEIDQGADSLDPDPCLLEVLLVRLCDPADSEVHDRRRRLDEKILDADLAKLLFEVSAELFLGRLFGRRAFHLAEPTPTRPSARERMSGVSPRPHPGRCRRAPPH